MGNREIAIGEDVYETISESGTFYVDKTRFIGKWFRKKHKVEMILRPRRFGKTLTLNTIKRFFSIQYQNQPEPFLNREIGKNVEMMKKQGTTPVISLTLTGITEPTYDEMIETLGGLKTISGTLQPTKRRKVSILTLL